MDLLQQTQQLYSKLKNIRQHYDNKVFVYFTNRTKNSQNVKFFQDLFYLKAYLFALQEQLNCLELNAKTDKSKAEFVGDLYELDFDNEQIESLLESRDPAALVAKYGAHRLPEFLRRSFDQNAEGLVRVIGEFVAKRKVHWKKNDNVQLLDELVYLKSKIIKHLCMIEKLSDKADKWLSS